MRLDSDCFYPGLAPSARGSVALLLAQVCLLPLKNYASLLKPGSAVSNINLLEFKLMLVKLTPNYRQKYRRVIIDSSVNNLKIILNKSWNRFIFTFLPECR